MSLLNELKDYLRIDGDEEDGSLNLLLSSSKSYLSSAGVPEPDVLSISVEGDDPNAKYILVACMLATHWYENRLVITPAVAKVEQTPIPYGAQSLILQLKAEALPIVSDLNERTI